MGFQGEEVGRLASSFDTMLAVLHESLTAQRPLVAGASHELRTPLTSLTTSLGLLETVPEWPTRRRPPWCEQHKNKPANSTS